MLERRSLLVPLGWSRLATHLSPPLVACLFNALCLPGLDLCHPLPPAVCMSQGVYLHLKAMDAGMLSGEGEGAGVFREESCAGMSERQEATRVEGSSRQSISTCVGLINLPRSPSRPKSPPGFPHRGARSHPQAAAPPAVQEFGRSGCSEPSSLVLLWSACSRVKWTKALSRSRLFLLGQQAKLLDTSVL